MPMLVVEDEDFELEMNRLSGPSSSIIKMDKLGRPDGCKETPESIRALIAGDKIAGNGTIKEIAKAYGVSTSAVTSYADDSTSRNDAAIGRIDTKLQEHNDKVRNKIRGRAQNKLALALKHITEDKLEGSRATDLSTIAANLSKVVDKTTPKSEGPSVTNNIHFYSPQQIGPNNFETIDVTPERIERAS